MEGADFLFAERLIEGVILRRRSQFTMDVALEGNVCTCHCPTTGRIGNIELAGIPCLLSKSKIDLRKTPYTVEAISLDPANQLNKSWIGINQTAANRYVEHFLTTGSFSQMISDHGVVKREQVIGKSKLDFLVGDTYVEVKTPLINLNIPVPEHVKTRKVTEFNSFERFVKLMTLSLLTCPL